MRIVFNCRFKRSYCSCNPFLTGPNYVSTLQARLKSSLISPKTRTSSDTRRFQWLADPGGSKYDQLAAFAKLQHEPQREPSLSLPRDPLKFKAFGRDLCLLCNATPGPWRYHSAWANWKGVAIRKGCLRWSPPPLFPPPVLPCNSLRGSLWLGTLYKCNVTQRSALLAACRGCAR